jgi:hypothetical protein
MARRLTRLEVGEEQCRPKWQSGGAQSACHLNAQCGRNELVLLKGVCEMAVMTFGARVWCGAMR